MIEVAISIDQNIFKFLTIWILKYIIVTEFSQYFTTYFCPVLKRLSIWYGVTVFRCHLSLHMSFFDHHIYNVQSFIV